ncbi:Reverse transcriptase domain-containing protein, partial [Aphis craccivora]
APIAPTSVASVLRLLTKQQTARTHRVALPALQFKSHPTTFLEAGKAQHTGPQGQRTNQPRAQGINLNCCKAAQALMHQIALNKSADFVLVSEYNRVEGPNWYADGTNKAAIVNVTKSRRLDKDGHQEPGFRWVCDRGLRIYSCYWSPNSTLQEYEDFISRLDASIRLPATEILLTGDFNAKHSDWGCPRNDRRGEVLADLITSAGLVVCNRGNKNTFSRGSIIDLTIASPRTAHTITKWTVLDEESLSDHYYLYFEINTGAPERRNPRVPKIDLKKLKETFAPEIRHPLLDCTDAETKSRALTDIIHECRRSTHAEKKPRKSVHWWNPELSVLHSAANHLRRVFQRKRKRHGPAASTAEETAAKEAKRELTRAIKRAKETSWKILCDQVQRDPWGLPYKLVMGKLTRPPPIPELNVPGRLQHIVDGLFPKHPRRDNSTWLHNQQLDGTPWKIDIEELKTAASRLRNKISPGIDGIPNEVVKVIVALNPTILLNVYNTCLAEDCLGKLFEKILDARLRRHLDDTGGLDDRQFGFRKGRSTIDALNTLRSTIKGTKLKIGVLTMDIKNAFNSAPWAAIMKAMYEKDVPAYLQQMVGSYLEDRKLLVEGGDDGTKQIDVTCGVPQGSVLGPTLWNILYDGLLRVRLSIGVKFLAFTDDVALVAEARDSIQLEQLLSVSARKVKDWLTDNRLQLALYKCEAMIITNTRTNNDMHITIGGFEISTCNSLKYLGLQLDSKWSFTNHAKAVTAKAGKTVQNLTRILPNISAAKSRKRMLLSNVVHSILLYGAPVWVQNMSKTGWSELLKIQRRIALRVTSAYCTVSGAAIGVISSIAPLDLMAIERKNILDRRGIPNTQHTEETLLSWENRWNNCTKGRWTHSLIRDLGAWTKRKHWTINFHLTQALSGHGCFSEYLHRFGKLNSPECWYCGHPSDDAYHTIFVCDAWYRVRNETEVTLGKRLSPDNMVACMLSSKSSWTRIDNMVHHIMTSKESEERRRQGAAG